MSDLFEKVEDEEWIQKKDSEQINIEFGINNTSIIG
jgi:hypothetical protein